MGWPSIISFVLQTMPNFLQPGPTCNIMIRRNNCKSCVVDTVHIEAKVRSNGFAKEKM
jgi:hypothetical protein